MKRRLLGKTGFEASVLGIGDLADRSVPLERCVATLHRAMDYGLNLVDTAPMYENGYSEQIVGAALKGRRQGMFVIDKIDRVDEPVEPQVDASLSALGLDAVDLFVFHEVSKPSDWKHIADTGMAELDRCRVAGKLRFRGISSHHPDVLRAALKSGLCDVVMFPVGPFVDRRYVDEILPLARRQGVGMVCFKTFGAGKLLGDTTGYNQPLQERPRGKFSSGGQEPAGAPQLPRLGVAECLHYTLTLDPDVTLLGLSFPNEQDAAFRAFEDFRPLTPGQLKDIEERAAKAIAGKGRCWWNPDESKQRSHLGIRIVGE
ncbi:MAG TPA: aldo/keto reductase [Candidatus Acidoferrum sp.]|nr:aldo/keto reductase [Candidatus Acidoferrum sp.]